MSGHEQRFARGETICKQGEFGDRTFLIKSGRVIVCKSGRPGEMIPIEELGPGEMFGEMYLMSEEHLRNATVVASEEVVTDVFFEDAVMEDMRQVSPIMKTVMKGLNKRLNKMNNHYVNQKIPAASDSESAEPPSKAPRDSSSPDYFS